MSFLLGALYVFLVLTVAIVCGRKGRWGFLIVGVFIPFLWIIGAILPARPGSNWARTRGY